MKRMNSSRLTLALTVMLLFILSACTEEAPVSVNTDFVNNTDFVSEASFSREIDGTGVSALRLDGINGTVSLVGAPAASTVTISGIRRVKSSSTEDAQEHLKLLLVDVQISAGEILVKTVQPQLTRGRQFLVDYTVRVPSSMDVIVGTMNGRVNLGGVLSRTSVDLTNGEIQSQMTLPLDGMLDLGVVNGNINLDLPAGTSAQFSAVVVNGSIDISGLDLQNTTQTINSLRGQLGDGRGSIILNTANGDISVRGF